MTTNSIHKWRKSVFSLLLAMAMVFSMLPISAFAEEVENQNIEIIEATAADAGDTIDITNDINSTTGNGGIGFSTNDEDDDPDALLTCDCVVECTGDAINADCPVCATQPELCVVGVNVGVENIMPVTASPGTTFAGGAGTQLDPWQINTKEMLVYLATQVNAGDTDYNNKHYRLTADIDISGYNASNTGFNSGKGWIPIGNNAGRSFTGTFDGDGKTISGLTMSGTVTHAGLFGNMDSGSAVKNLGVTGVNINVPTSTAADIGGLVGKISSGSVTNCHVTGSVSVTHTGGMMANVSVGGIVGNSSGSTSITACYSTASVSVANNGNSNVVAYVGGLVGINSSSVTNCFATGNVTTNTTQSSGVSSNTGGLVGRNTTAGAIKNCYATGNVTGISGMVHTTGGLVGSNDGGDPTIKNCYATGNVTGGANTGGLVGLNSTGCTITDSYWNSNATQTAGGTVRTTTQGVGGGSGTSSDIGMTAANMKAVTFLTTLNSWVVAANMALLSPPAPATYLTWVAVTDGFPTLPLVIVPPPPPPPPAPPTPTPTPSGGGGSSSPVAPAAPVITPLDNKSTGTLNTAIHSAANAASSSGNEFGVKLKNVSNFTKDNAAAILAKAKSLGKKATVSSDIMSENGKYVEVRVTVDPALIQKNVRLDGYTRESQTFITESKFKKYFDNKTAFVHLGQEGKFGQTAKIAAKLDLSGFDSDNLYFYSYDKKANKYTRIDKSAYRIDKNGYLHFETDFGGDIIISNGKLVKK